MKTPISALLHGKAPVLFSVSPSTTVHEAVGLMVANRIGCVLVLSGQTLAGLFTERDALVKIVAQGLDPRGTLVASVMTPTPPTVTPETPLDEAMMLFSDRRVRQLPVVEQERVVGLVSIGDANKWVVDHLKFEAETLRSYVAGGYPG